MTYSLVDAEKLRRDPRKLAFLYPKMPVIRYKQLTEDYHRNITLMTAEKIADMFGAVLLPSSCVHHSRRRPDRRLMIYGRVYYVREMDDVTEMEWEKFRCTVQEMREADG